MERPTARPRRRLALGLLALFLTAGPAPALPAKGGGEVHAAPASPEVVAARLAKIEKFVAAGDRDTALALLQNLSHAYPGEAAFHLRAAELALESGAPRLADRIARDLEARAPGDPRAAALRSRAYQAVMAKAVHVTDVEDFARLALRMEIDLRGARILAALRRYETRKGVRVELDEATSATEVEALRLHGFLTRPQPALEECGAYLTSPTGLRCARDLDGLPRPRRAPVPERAVLVEALRHPHPVVRRHARQLLIRARQPAPVLAAAAAQAGAAPTLLERLELAEDLAAALKVSRDLGVDLAGLETRELVLDLLRADADSDEPELQLLSAYGRALLGEATDLAPAVAEGLFTKFAGSAPGTDPAFLAALIRARPARAKVVVQRLRKGAHRQAQAILFRGLAGRQDDAVLRFLVDSLGEDRYLTSYVAILDTLAEITGQRFETAGEWQGWLQARR